MISNANLFGIIQNLRNAEKLQQWCNLHPDLEPYLTFLEYNNRDPRFSYSNYKSNRRSIHSKVGDELYKFVQNLDVEIRNAKDEIEHYAGISIPQVPTPCYEDKSQIMTLRKYTFIRRKKQKKLIAVASAKYSYFYDLSVRAKNILMLFTSNIIPEAIICKIDLQFYKVKFTGHLARSIIKLNYIREAGNRLKTEIESFPVSLWYSNYSKFLYGIVTQSAPHVDPELSYFLPLEEEVSLSRCLFNHNSMFLKKIDPIVRSIKTVNGDEFVQSIIILIYYDLMPDRNTVSIADQSVALLLLFRAIYNRCYEICPTFFAPKPNNDIAKINRLKSIPCMFYPLPKHLMKPNIDEQPIRQVFQADRFFLAASQFLYSTIFQSNPIDMLYYIHKTLIAIHKGALINRMGDQAASVDDVTQLLCFDDLFSLFFGALMASDLPDLNYVSWVINEYSPKECLSPSFEYAQANIEALILHCQLIDVENLEKKTAEFNASKSE